ncbi:MAG TPA: hypothetical protein VMU14_23895 [Acidimicrobiales bacterium]|jgi:hypothetical protein|nr:hypothetical protein [Acidimicrobiales bacterium]
MNVANLLYLVGAVAAIVVILSTLYLRNRKPKTMEYGIDSFQRELRALAPDAAERDGRRSG